MNKVAGIVVAVWGGAMLILQALTYYETKRAADEADYTANGRAYVEDTARHVEAMREELRSIREATPGASTPLESASDPYSDMTLEQAGKLNRNAPAATPER